LKLRWTRRALADFEQAHDHIAKDNPEAARQIAKRLLDATETLLEYPRIGRVGEDEDSREWQVDKTPYLLVYAIRDEVIEVWRVWHLARDPSTR
jgi:addiction module RelE/StbE family toxin